jgi:hypothetical protein
MRSIYNKDSDRKKDELWNKISRHKRPLLPILRIAAVFLILLVPLSTIFLKRLRDNNLSSYTKCMMENTSETGLFISDGTRIPIKSNRSTIEYSDNGSKVSINSDKQLSQAISKETFNRVLVPFGKIIQITLSDGSKVWAQSGSLLIFPPVFHGDKREVYLSGEAYFEVTKNIKKPFVVRTDLLSTKVLGTKFLVQAYADDHVYSTLLIEGAVSLFDNKSLLSKGIHLRPGQKGTVGKNDSDIEVRNVPNTYNYTSWIYGYMIFNDEKLADLFKRVSRYYNINIDYPEYYSHILVSGKLELKEDHERVLESIGILAGLSLSIEEGHYTFANN